jgi:hypothetical protein
MYLALKLTLGSIVTGAAARILNLWNKLSRRWEVETRNWENIS